MKATIKALSEALRALKSFRRVTTPVAERSHVLVLVEKGEAVYVCKEKP